LVNQVQKKTDVALGPGAVVAGKYRVERTLAEGGMGVVVLARHIHLQQSVALKFLRGDVGTEWDALARFRGEAKAVAQLRSEHVAHVLDAGVTDDGVPYMVMEYLEGRSLARKLQIDGPLSVPLAVEYVIQACEGLAEAHARGIVHRDIKPYNLFLVEDAPGWGCVKIIDFGISKFAFSDTPNIVTGVIIGSPCYMSPEQLRSTASADHRSDLWSLGATLHELLVGKAAFDASQTLPELVTAILERPTPDLRELRPSVPEELSAIVAKCLAKDREARFQSAGEVAMALLPFAPARARVPAERAASMTPAAYEARRVREIPRSDAQEAEHALRTASLAPLTRDEAGAVGDVASSLVETALVHRTGDADGGGDVVPIRRRSPKWLGLAALGGAAALLFFAILVAAADNGTKVKTAAWSNTQSVMAPAVTRPEGPLPTATLAPVDPPQPELAELVVRAQPSSARISIDGAAVSGNPFHASYPRGAESKHRITVAAGGYETRSQDIVLAEDAIVELALSRRGSSSVNPSPPATPAPARVSVAKAAPAPRSPAAPAGPLPIIAQAPMVTASGNEVDATGGRAPFRPIETKDPYGAP
jgi:serine/threonine-protein kinase